MKGFRSAITVHLRPYHPDDCEAVVRLWYESWHHNFPDLYHPWTYAQWREHFQDKVTAHASIWIAESAGQVAGFIVVRENDGCLDQIFVAPAMQHQGVGTILLNKAKELSPDGIYLDTLQSNTNARRFYEKHGFQPGQVSMNPNSGQPDIEYRWTPQTEMSE
jgi:putative acetyltransferase